MPFLRNVEDRSCRPNGRNVSGRFSVFVTRGLRHLRRKQIAAWPDHCNIEQSLDYGGLYNRHPSAASHLDQLTI